MGVHSGNVQGTSEFVCEICLNSYDAITRKPYSLVPCGHSFCILCMNQMQNFNCPVCRAQFSNKIPNWEILKLLKVTVPTAPGFNPQEAPVLVQNRNQNEQGHSHVDHFFGMSSKRKCNLYFKLHS